MIEQTEQTAWKRTSVVIILCNTVNFLGYSLMIPFLVLYLQEIGVPDPADAAKWAGFIGAAQGISFAISAPFWGYLADRIGRKPMVVRAMLVSGIGIAAAGFVNDPMLLFLVVLFRGFASGPGTASISLMATIAPSNQLTRIIGWVEAAHMVGMTAGLAAGGILAGTIGMQNTFVAGGILSITAGLLVQIFAVENFQRPEPNDQSRSSQGNITNRTGRIRNVLSDLGGLLTSNLWILCILQGSLWFSGNGINFVLPLQIQELTDRGAAAFWTGMIQSGFSALTFVGVLVVPELARKWGYQRVLVGSLIAFAILFIPQALSPSIITFAAFRILQGVAFGFVGPLQRSLVGLAAPQDRTATVYGIQTTLAGTGMTLGPLVLGTLIAGNMGVSASFICASTISLSACLLALRRLDADSIAK